MKFVIIGSGIIGLSVGVRILENIAGANVTIYSESFPPNTTGDIAAGLLLPYAIDVNDKRIERWFSKTFEYMKKMVMHDPEHYKKGALYEQIYCLSENKIELDKTGFLKIFEDIRNLNSSELDKFGNHKYGVSFTTLMAEGVKIINYLQNLFLKLGGKMFKQKVNNFDEIQLTENFDVVINCTGIGAIYLCNDSQAYPIRGQILKIYAPWIKYGVITDHNYIFPQSDGYAVLGGVKQKGNWSLEVNKLDTEHILRGCEKLMQGIKSCPIVSEHVGLRPGRTNIRLEKEQRINQITGRKYQLIHNYGHGGSGLSLFWGCAEDVLHLINTRNEVVAKL